LPGLHQFSTLSPVPGFRRWLEKRLDDPDALPDLLRSEERDTVYQAAGLADAGTDAAALRRLLQTDQWWNNATIASALRPPLLRACALCLTQIVGPRVPPDPVARFHLGNGARLEQINWLANVAPRGIKESFGVMVNYLYDPPTIEANHEGFVRDRKVARSVDVDALLATPTPPPESRRSARARRQNVPAGG
jgi:malonyl-CoA decarboxylase